MPSDTSEQGLERLVCTMLTGQVCDPPSVGQPSQPIPVRGGVGWSPGNPCDYDREFCLDVAQLAAFVRAMQPKIAAALSLDMDCPPRRKFLARLHREISKRGTVELLRNGVRHHQHDLDLLYGTPSVGNPQAQQRFDQNRFTVVRQLRYSLDETRRALDIVLFVNGLPVLTFELKNSLTKQTVADAVEQYKRDRNPRERLFEFGRCVAHFAVDENEARFCTHLKGKASWFLPFNRGWNDGAGNPPNPNGIKTDYLWREVLTRKSLTSILENYAQVVVEPKAGNAGRRIRRQIWPRYHQLDVVRRLLTAAAAGAGRRYLIQHSAGSGKSNSIAWLAHQLIGLQSGGETTFDSIIVVTDRVILDRQIAATIKQYAQVGATVGRAERSGQLREFLEAGKKIIISTVQKFPFIHDEIGSEQRNRRFAILIDEAHSSQGGQTSSAMSAALGSAGQEAAEETAEDRINRIMESRKLLRNASYFAFTATPKHKTLEMFGDSQPLPDGTVQHRAFHAYSMKQAIQEGFILDVLAHYTPVASYYRLAKTVTDDPQFDTRKAQKKLRRFVEGHDHAIRLKAEIMVDHFHAQVMAKCKIGGAARAMIVTNGIANAIRYFHALRDCLKERKSPYRAIVAFSGESEFGGRNVTESSLNGFPPGQIIQKFRDGPYRFLVCADKFQTGYDEPLLHTMYVDKTLSGIKAVQTLSRLNRAHPKKHDAFVLDFQNDADTIRAAFADFYRTTILADETDPNKLHDLQADLDNAQIYSLDQVDELVETYLGGAERDQLDPILDVCVTRYVQDLGEDGQVDFKAKAKAFVRTHAFLSCVLPYADAGWEKRSIFLNFLIPKLPAPQEEDLSRGILEAIDMDSYRVEKQAMEQIELPDEDAEIDPVPTQGGGGKPDPELAQLSQILREFNDLFGAIPWKDSDRVVKVITQDIPSLVAKDSAFRNARQNSDSANTRIEHDRVLGRVVTGMMQDNAELFKQFSDNEDFRRWMGNTVHGLACSLTPAGSARSTEHGGHTA